MTSAGQWETSFRARDITNEEWTPFNFKLPQRGALIFVGYVWKTAHWNLGPTRVRFESSWDLWYLGTAVPLVVVAPTTSTLLYETQRALSERRPENNLSALCMIPDGRLILVGDQSVWKPAQLRSKRVQVVTSLV